MSKSIKNLEFGEELSKIISIYRDGSEDALDGDEVDGLVEHLRNQANLMEGNITEDEYEELEDLIHYSPSLVQFNEEKIKSQYDDFSKDKKYTYDVFVINPKTGKERFENRYMDLSLNDLAMFLAMKREFRLEQHGQFEDWYFLQIDNCKRYYRIQLFQ